MVRHLGEEPKFDNKYLKYIKNLLPLLVSISIIVGGLIALSNILPIIYFSDVNIDTYGPVYSSAKWDYEFYNVRPWEGTHWAFFNMDIRNRELHFDLRNYKGVRFYIKGLKETQKIIFNVFTQESIITNMNDSTLIQYQYSTDENINVNNNWTIKTIYWSDLKKTNETVPDLEDVLDKVFAIGFTVNYNPKPWEIKEKSIIWIDEIKLIRENGTSGESLGNFTSINVNISGVDGIWHWGTGPS